MTFEIKETCHRGYDGRLDWTVVDGQLRIAEFHSRTDAELFVRAKAATCERCGQEKMMLPGENGILFYCGCPSVQPDVVIEASR